MSLAHSISSRNRERKWRLFERLVRPTQQTRVLDVGFSDEEYSPADNFLEKRYRFPERITALSVDRPHRFRQWYPRVRTVTYGGGRFPFQDQSFDVCWSNAVLEHVGDKGDQTLFLSEIRRVARMGFVTTPNRRFPIEVHTRFPLVHWLPTRLFDRAVRLLGKGWAAGDYMQLLSERDLRQRLAAAGIEGCRIYRNRFCLVTLDFVAVFGDVRAMRQTSML